MSPAPGRPVLLVVAKVPVPGLAKTRLTPQFGPVGAACLASAALLDTLDTAVAAAAMAGAEVVVAVTGRIDDAVEPGALSRALADLTVIEQRGQGFGDRLAYAHVDAAAGRPVLQIGMDTPQVTADLLVDGIHTIAYGCAGLGRAPDGGWWALAMPRGELATCLREVPMSRPNTAERTIHALTAVGLRVEPLPVLADVDTAADVTTVGRQCSGRFGALALSLTQVAS